MITIDDKVQFDPFEEMTGFATHDFRGNYVTGTVVFINYEHKWFSVEYECGGKKLRNSFNFCDIGKTVTVCGK